MSVYCFLSLKQNSCREYSGKTIFLKKDSLLGSQRVVPRVSFYGSKQTRMDNVMVDAGEEEGVPLIFFRNQYMNLWFAKIPSFIRLYLKSVWLPSLSSARSSSRCSKKSRSSSNF